MITVSNIERKYEPFRVINNIKLKRFLKQVKLVRILLLTALS